MARTIKHPAGTLTPAQRQIVKRDIIRRAKLALDGAGIPFWLSCGALLGYYREGDVMLHDPDVDLGIWAEHKPDNLDSIMLAQGFEVCHHRHHNPDCCAYKLRGVKLDLFFHRRCDDGKVRLTLLDNQGQQVVYVYDAFDLIPATFLNLTVCVPSNPVRMLQTQYGDQWYIPVTAWKWDVSPAHMAGREKSAANYWDGFYADKCIMPPSWFAKHCLDSGLISGKLLELGCGDGRDAIAFMNAATSVTAVDQSKYSIDRLRTVAPGARWLHDDFTHLHLPEEFGTFDVVYSRFTLHSISLRNEVRTLERAHKLLKPGGRLLIEARTKSDPLYGQGMPLGPDEFVTTHYRRFLDVQEFAARLRANGFEVQSLECSKGWARTESEDPEVVRVVAVRMQADLNKLHDNWQRNVTAIVKTFEAPDSVRCAVDSLRACYPDMPIIVADDSASPRPMPDVDWHRLPYDSGLSAGRNYMLDRVATPYFLLVDDDFVFTESADLKRMYDVLRKHDLDLVAGAVRSTTGSHSIYHYEGVIEVADGHLRVEPRMHAEYDDHGRCDLVLNFFIANTTAVRTIGGWDPELKLSEHLEFFLRAKDRLKIGYVPNVVVEHDKAVKLQDADYRLQRETKALIGRARMMEKHGLKSLQVNGTRYDYAAVKAKANAAAQLAQASKRLARRSGLRSDPYPKAVQQPTVRNGGRVNVVLAGRNRFVRRAVPGRAGPVMPPAQIRRARA